MGSFCGWLGGWWFKIGVGVVGCIIRWKRAVILSNPVCCAAACAAASRLISARSSENCLVVSSVSWRTSSAVVCTRESVVSVRALIFLSSSWCCRIDSCCRLIAASISANLFCVVVSDFVICEWVAVVSSPVKSKSWVGMSWVLAVGWGVFNIGVGDFGGGGGGVLFVAEGRLRWEKEFFVPWKVTVADKLVEYSQKASFPVGFGLRLVPVPSL